MEYCCIYLSTELSDYCNFDFFFFVLSLFWRKAYICLEQHRNIALRLYEHDHREENLSISTFLSAVEHFQVAKDPLEDPDEKKWYFGH